MSRGSARVPVSIKVTSGASERRIEPGRISVRAKTPKPFPSDSCTVMIVSSVSGYRSGGGWRSAGGELGLGGAFTLLFSLLSSGTFVAIRAGVGGDKNPIMSSDADGKVGARNKAVSKWSLTARCKCRRGSDTYQPLQVEESSILLPRNHRWSCSYRPL